MDRRMIALGLAVVLIVGVTAAWSPRWFRGSTALEPIDSPQPPKTGEKFGQDRDPLAGITPLPFDSERAMKYLKRLCEIGPRVSGTDGIKTMRDLVVKHFEEHGGKVTVQTFDGKQRSRKDKTPMANVIVKWDPDKTNRVILCCHYDTRPIADQEANKLNWNKPFLSANDGTSGVAMLMELAHHMKDVKANVGIDFVLFDGEEYVFDTNPVTGDDYFLGSEYFAREYAKSKSTRTFKYTGALLFDLCHHENAQLTVEAYSYQFAPSLVQQVWKVAELVKAKSFKYERGPEVRDDHLALNMADIPAVDIIDFGYVHWHKLTDTVDKVSPKQMAEVANVAMTWVRIVK
jgi:hypothetical protein